METVRVPSNTRPVGAIILLVLAGLLYALMMANLVDSNRTDAAGRGLAMAFAVLVALVLWLVLAILLVVGFVRSRMPTPVKAAAFILLPLSAVAVCVAIDPNDGRRAWAILVPALLAPLIALYGLWACLPALHARFPVVATSAVLGGAILAITLAPLAVTIIESLPDPARDARRMALENATQEKLRRQDQRAGDREAARFDRLNPASSLRDYLEYLPGGYPRSGQALQGARLVRSRQADAVALLKEGQIRALPTLWRLDLEATASLCEAFGAALGREAGKINRTRSDYLSAALDLERQLPNIKWFVAAHCDLGEALGTLEARVREVSDSSRMEQFAATLVALRQSR